MIKMAVGQQNAFYSQTFLNQKPPHRSAGFGRIDQDAGLPARIDQNIGVGVERAASETLDLKLPAASGGESSICREKTSYIRSLTPGQAPGNALAVRFNGSIRIQDSPAGRDGTDSGHERTHTPQMCTPIPLSLENSVSFAWHRSSL